LAAAVTDVVSLLEPELRAKGMADSVQIDRSVRVRADREKLRQVLLNLLANAIKFTDEGGHLTVRAAERDDVTMALTVADTGIGIPQDKLSIIFDPFVQVHRDHTRPREGTGLGLAISRDLARGMEGDLTVESEVGMGSTFTLLLPSATPVRGSETSDRAGGQASMPD
jgi:signal transduction histidine kinase